MDHIMCAECVKSVNDIFPEVPEEEVGGLGQTHNDNQ